VKLKVNVQAFLQVPYSVPTVLQVEPVQIDGAQTIVSESMYITPHSQFAPYVDLYGNRCRRGLLASGDIRLDYNAVIELSEGRTQMIHAIDTAMLDLPTEILPYLLPSRYCEVDRLMQMAHSEFGETQPGYARVQTICGWINQHVRYQYGTTTASTTACDTAVERIGVCRDFAHLAIGFCRSMGIPARYVSGYCLELDPQDFHAFFQAWLDGRWVSFDATEMQPRTALVTVATGRDAADCAWCTFYGMGTTTSLNVDISLVS
jgi:transglutaminase-like putative cysteine protease